METKHAPATWQLDDSVRPVRVVADGLVICEIPPHAAGLDIDIGRRIAATPDMMKALSDCVAVMERELDGLRVIEPELRAARAALRRATWGLS